MLINMGRLIYLEDDSVARMKRDLFEGDKSTEEQTDKSRELQERLAER